MQHLLQVITAVVIAACAQGLNAASFVVPGTSTLWLAGMPNGSASGGDTAPAQSPVLVTNIFLTPGSALYFSASGTVMNGPVGTLDGPDGGELRPHAEGTDNGISDFTAPLNSLLGVFLDSTQPSLSPAPSPFTYLPGATTISPGLRQVFFIGDGLTGTATGVPQQFIVPSGATRLFLGTMDGAEWSNNTGSFSGTVVPEPALGNWVRWSVSEGGNEHWYLPVQVATPISWNDAFIYAQIQGGYLATITSAAENAFVFRLIDHPQYWNGGFGPLLGGYQPPGSPEPGGGWTWVTGEAWGYSNWSVGQPDNGAEHLEDGLHFFNNRQWNDYRRSNRSFLGYVIESDICTPHKARATALLLNGFVVGATITDSGCGYTNAPVVLIQGGGGTGATGSAVVSNGVVVGINFTSAGSGYTDVPRIVIGSPPFVPTVSIAVSKVKVTQNVVLGRKYLLESSTDLISWTATGPQFTAESETIVNEFDVNETRRFLRIREVP